jgi:hypothetical protein
MCDRRWTLTNRVIRMSLLNRKCLVFSVWCLADISKIIHTKRKTINTKH